MASSDRMSTRSPAGTKVVFDGDGGTDAEKMAAHHRLTVGNDYAVDRVQEGNFVSFVMLKEFPGEWFNTVLFRPYVAPHVDAHGVYNCPCGRWHMRGPMPGNQNVYRCLRCGQHRSVPTAPAALPSEMETLHRDNTDLRTRLHLVKYHAEQLITMVKEDEDDDSPAEWIAPPFKEELSKLIQAAQVGTLQTDQTLIPVTPE